MHLHFHFPALEIFPVVLFGNIGALLPLVELQLELGKAQRVGIVAVDEFLRRKRSKCDQGQVGGCGFSCVEGG
jgi:hypothetical protein